MLDTRLPLTAQGIDTTQAIPQMQQAEMNTIQTIREKYAAASDAEKLDILSTGLGAAQALSLADVQPDSVVPFLEKRMGKIDERVKMGLASDSNDTKNLIEAYKRNPEEFKALAGAYVKTARLAGAFDKGTDAQGGATGVLLDRIVEEGKKTDPNYDLLTALEDLKGGAGQRGRNNADIQLGEEAERNKATGKSFGDKQGAAIFDLPRLRATGAEAITAIDNALSSPGLKNITGWMSLVPITPGGERARAEALLDQVGGRQFLAAYEMLKGGGQITEIEGKKGEDAIAALGRAQKYEDIVQALNDLRGVIVRSVQAKEQAATQTPKEIKQNNFNAPLQASDFKDMTDEDILKALQ